MKKIEPLLADSIARNAEKVHEIIIVCSSDEHFQNMGFTRIMKNIYSAKLSGHEIKKLVSLSEVVSIELDKTITIE